MDPDTPETKSTPSPITPSAIARREAAEIELFADDHLNSNHQMADKEASFQRDLWQLCAKRGILGLTCPTEYSGGGISTIDSCALLEALGHGCRNNGLLFALGTQIWGLQKSILKFGNDNQKRNYLPAMINGDMIGCFAINEYSSGSDAISLSTTATKDGDKYILNGEKSLIAMAPVADFALVFANSNPQAGRWGVSAFLIDRNTPGIELHSANDMMGLRTAPVGKITLRECKIPDSSLLGQEGSGATLFNYAQIWERSMLLAPQIGTMQRQINESVKFAKNRSRGGINIGKHQAISNRIADMAIRLETSRLLQQKAATLLDNEKFDIFNAAIAKTHISETFEINSRDMLAIMGGSGYLTEYGIENDLRDAIGSTIYGGTTDIQRNIISGFLGL